MFMCNFTPTNFVDFVAQVHKHQVNHCPVITTACVAINVMTLLFLKHGTRLKMFFFPRHVQVSKLLHELGEHTGRLGSCSKDTSLTQGSDL